MTGYRCYFLSADGKIVDVEPIAAQDSDEALRLSRRLLSERPSHAGFELWQRDKKIHTEMREHPAPA